MEPTRRQRLRPFELVGLSFLIAVFGALVVLVTSREIIFTLIVFGASFIVSLVVIAMVVLAIKPNKAELADIEELDAEASTKPSAH